MLQTKTRHRHSRRVCHHVYLKLTHGSAGLADFRPFFPCGHGKIQHVEAHFLTIGRAGLEEC